MLCNTILIGVSFFGWYFAISAIFLFDLNGELNGIQVVFIEASVRLIRILCQQFAFAWILISFSKYGTNVDKKMEKRDKKRKSLQLRKDMREPDISVKCIDEDRKNPTGDIPLPAQRDIEAA